MIIPGPAGRLRHAVLSEPSGGDRARTTPDPAADPSMPTPLALELLAAVVSAGAAPQQALAALTAAAPGTTVTAGERALDLALRSGLPPAGLLRAAAQRERIRQSLDARAAIRRLEVLLVVPAGLCLLPAFVLLGVAPVVIALLRSAV